ncbi:homeobox-containing protein [Cryptosporidium ryanae]|uniref:homeobox-containing protein n=1 Tax=Cryptosporidium ryanae TaxID=515981 RepID=UPI00351A2E12|nr:homeobox-containing protein [Cryptosporidium ryanae]
MEKDDSELIIDGETEIDDLLLASKFAELENIKYKSILSEVDNTDSKIKILSKILTDNEHSSESSSDSENECDVEIKELIKNEMRYRYKNNHPEHSTSSGFSGEIKQDKYTSNSDNDDISIGNSGKLSNEYLSKFGIKLDVDNKADKNDDLEDVHDMDEFGDLSDDNHKIRADMREKFNGKNRLGLDEIRNWLPNIEVIDMPEKVDHYLPCEYVGDIYSEVCDYQVNGKNSVYIIKGDPSGIILDLGSVLCLEDKTIIGTLIDTFGPINSPFYVLSKQDKVDSSILNVGTKIYCDRRHSTVLGKGGKLKRSCLSESNINNRNSVPLDRKSVHSLFLGKEFAKETVKRNKTVNNNNSGSELEEGEDSSVDESGDDIGYDKVEHVNKRFVEKYENLGLVQESCIEDSIGKIKSASNKVTNDRCKNNVKYMKQKCVNKIREVNNRNIRKTFHNNINDALNVRQNNKYLNTYGFNIYNNHSYVNDRNNNIYPSNVFINQANQVRYCNDVNMVYNNERFPQISQNSGIFQNHVENVNGNSTTQLYSEFGQSSHFSGNTSINDLSNSNIT